MSPYAPCVSSTRIEGMLAAEQVWDPLSSSSVRYPPLNARFVDREKDRPRRTHLWNMEYGPQRIGLLPGFLVRIWPRIGIDRPDHVAGVWTS